MADTPITDYTKLDAESKATIAANAKYQGITPQEYLTSRGGVYKSGYFGDTPEYRRIPDDLYEQLAAKGTAAINAEILRRTKEAYQKDPNLIDDPMLRQSFMSGRLTIDQLMQAIGLDKTKSQPMGFDSLGVLADGTPFYGWDAQGKPVTSPTGVIYSRTSPSDATSNANSGASPLTFSSSSTATGATGTGTGDTDKGFAERKSAYDLLYQQFAQYGLQTLVEPLKNLIIEGVSPSEFTIRLRETDAYKKRFAANQARINQGLRALSEAEYIGLEDQYQDIMRRYGMPESYYKKGDLGTQAGFEKFIGFDVSPVELEDRIQTAQSRVFDANPEVAATLKQFYPGITNGDILAYVLDPKSALPELKRKITAAEIGAGATMAGLQTGLQRATELASYGVTKEQAQQGFQTIADILPRGGQLASIYGEPAYTQTTAEQEVFGLAGATEAAKQRRKLTSLEQAAFSGSSGMAGTALGRERAGQF
jgi:hypothetical protein